VNVVTSLDRCERQAMRLPVVFASTGCDIQAESALHLVESTDDGDDDAWSEEAMVLSMLRILARNML
jgi:hypothetical protein